MLRFFKKVFFIFYRSRGLVKRELQMKESVPLGIKLSMWAKGFLAVSYYRYNLKVNDHRLYVSDYADNIKAIEISEGYAKYLDSKLLFPILIDDEIPIARILGIIMTGKYICIDKTLHVSSFSMLLDYVKNKSSVFIKPIDGSTGGNIKKLEYTGSSFYLNAIALSPEEVIKDLQKLNNYLIQPTVIQTGYAQAIFPRTTNTVRILTAIDPETQEAYIAHVIHRFGRDYSYPVDNYARGGISCNVNIETGVIEKGAYIYPASKTMIWHSKHPESGEQIEGIRIPHWEALKVDILKVANKFSFIALVGWDVVITDESYVLLEGNHGPDVKVHQIHTPLLSDSRLHKFFKYHNVVK